MLATLSRWRSRVRVPLGTLSEFSMARYANRQSGEAQNFVIVCGFNSHPCHWNQGEREAKREMREGRCSRCLPLVTRLASLFPEFVSVGHWQAQVAVTHPPSGNAGSTPARHTEE